MITLNPSTPVVKPSRHSGDMLNDVTCWKIGVTVVEGRKQK
jgi:hypothetical protein